MKILRKIFTMLALIGIIAIPFQTFASTIPVTPALFESALSFPEATTDTSFTLVSNALQNGVLPAGYTCFTVDQGQPNTEFECGTVSGTTVTGVTRGIDPITGNTTNSALVFSHRRGADVKITDFPTLTVLSRILSAQDTLPNTVSYAPGVSPVGGQDLTTKSYVLSVVNGGPVLFNQLVVAGTAGSNVTKGNLVYLNFSDGKWYPANAGTTTTIYAVQLGIAQSTASTGNSITSGVLISGVDSSNTGTAGAYAYASNTNGIISGSAGTNQLIVGQYIIGNGGLYFDPSFFYVPTAGQSQALSGSTGTPSSSNKYLTQNILNQTASPGMVPQLDSNGFIPLLQLGNRGNEYVTSGSGTIPTNGTTMTVTHNLGVVPKTIKITAYGNSSGSTVISSSYGIANMNAAGNVSYNASMFGTSSGNSTTNSYTDRILDLQQAAGGGEESATLSGVNSTSFIITFSKTSNPPASWSYVIDVTY